MNGTPPLTDEDLDRMPLEQLEAIQLQRRKPESFTDDELNRMPVEQLNMLRDNLARKKYSGELTAARSQVSEQGGLETTPHRVARAVVGYAHGPISNTLYNRAVNRLREGSPDQDDFRTISMYEFQRDQDAARSPAAKFGLAAAQVPGEAVAMFAGGQIAGAGLKAAGIASKAAQLPAMAAAAPQTWLQGAERNSAEDRNLFDPRGHAASLGHMTAQLAALEVVGGVTGQMMPAWFKDNAFVKSVADKVGDGPVGKAALGAVSGPFTMAAADVLTSAVGIDEGYGSIGLAFQGKFGEATQKVAIDALTFAAFASMHGRNGKTVFEELFGRKKKETTAPEDTPPPAGEAPPEDTTAGADPNAPKGRHYRQRPKGRQVPPDDPQSGGQTGSQGGGQQAPPPPPDNPGGGPPPGTGARERWWKQASDNTRKYAEDLLGVGKDFTEADLRAAFGAKAREFHPDTADGPDAASRFQEAKAAYEHLKRYAKKNPPPPPRQEPPRPEPKPKAEKPTAAKEEPTPADGTERLRELMGGGKAAEPAAEPAAEESAPRQFKTSKGSVYELHDDGTTTRTKSLHEGHETTDVGVKPRSEKTVYVSEEDAKRIGMWNSLQGTSGKRLLLQGDQVLLTSIPESTGKRGKDGAPIKFSTEPAVGLHPLELTARSAKAIVEGAETWKGNHPGNAITELAERPAEKPAEDPAAVMKEYIAPEPTKPEPAAKPSLAERMKARGRIGLKDAAPRTGAADATVRTDRPPEPPAPPAAPEPPKPKVSAFRQKQLDQAKERQDFIRDLHAEGYSFAMIADHPEFPHGKITRARVQQLAKDIGLTEETRETTADDRKRSAAERVYESVIESREANESPAGFDPEVDITERSQADARDAVRAEVLGATNSRFAGENGEEGEKPRSAFRTDQDYAIHKLDNVSEQALRAGDMATFVKISEMIDRIETQNYTPSKKEMKDATSGYENKKKRDYAEVTPEQQAILRNAGSGSQAASEGGQVHAPTGPGRGAKADRPLAGATSAGGRPGPGTPKQRVEREISRWSGLKQLAREFLADERGTVDLNVVMENLRQARMSFEKLGGVQFPRTAALSKEAAVKASIMAGSEQFPRYAAEFYYDYVFGENADPVFARRMTAAIVELRLRKVADAHQANADALLDANGNPPMTAKGTPTSEWRKHQELANNVSTKVGTEFKDEADFIAAVSDPAFDGIYQRWADGPGAEGDNMYRRSRGFSPTDTVFSPTQLDDLIMPLIDVNHTRVDPLTGHRVKTREGNLRNAKIKSNTRAKMAKGHGDYSVDPKQIMEEWFWSQSRLAAHADLVEQYEKDGIGIVGKSGVVPDIDGEPAIKTDFLNRPKNYKGPHGPDQVLYLHRDAVDEYRDLIQIDRKAHIMAVTPVAKAITAVQMVSGADLFSHVQGLTAAVMTLEGSGLLGHKNIIPTIGYFRDSVRNNMEIKKSVMELARLNMIVDHGEPHSGGMRIVNNVLGTSFNEKAKLDPLAWGARGLHHYNRAIRLAARDGYLRLCKETGETPNDKDMIDYVGQCLNYSKTSQNQFVRWCRDVGLGPFATAAAGTSQKAARLVLGMTHKQGTPKSWKRRAWQELIGGFIAVQAASMALNYSMWGDVTGDDNTPWLGVKVGKGEYIDIHPFTLLARRGSRALGMHALGKGLYEEVTGKGDGVTGDTFAKMTTEMFEAIAHPVIGPPVESATVFLSGKNTRGFQEAETKGNKFWNRTKAAVANFMPVPDTDAVTEKGPLKYAASWIPIFGLKSRKPKKQPGQMQPMTSRKLGLK